MNVVIVTHISFSEKQKNYLMVEDLINCGHKIYYVYVGDYLNVKYKLTKAQYKNDDFHYCEISRIEEFINYILPFSQIKKEVLFISILDESIKAIKLLKLLKKYGFYIASYNLTYNFTLCNTWKEKLYSAFRHKKLMSAFLRLYIKKSNIGPQIVITNNISQENKKGYVVLNSIDYNQFLKRGKANPQRGDYIVFLDQYIPKHPDNIYNRGYTYPADNYFKQMNKFFDTIEKITGKEIIVAAHPIADYTNEYGRRKIIKNQTISLVENAFLVLAHFSTAISYAILYRKPLIFINMVEFKRLNVYSKIYEVSKLLEMPCIDISNDNYRSMKIQYQISEENYSSYVNKYLASERNANFLNFQILNNFFKEISNE